MTVDDMRQRHALEIAEAIDKIADEKIAELRALDVDTRRTVIARITGLFCDGCGVVKDDGGYCPRCPSR